ncbi:pilus assembly FimT family protein [Nitratiruptor sp. SB155-2]|uniref:pilus assembly FimT family protein n=1 Tax=Nitratiruptor sp. (strain SB155-2) TaxID=387092 RepID=UPI00015872CE|nr:type II secretion system protein [Nitratiruptor sp. SB155-2]BAF70428.1 conserved hypothetical protein [Nitratiruptor sp. SB155-2]
MVKRDAFTLYELIIVIVTIGILAAVAIPRLKTNTLQEETMQVVDFIRYTQHLAMVDDKYDPSDPNWQQKAWCIQVNENNLSIFSGNVYAKDPITNKEITGGLKDNSNRDFQITLSPHTTICFDELGRPYQSNNNDIKYNHLLRNILKITASYEGKEINISIQPETGFVSLQ